MKYRWIGKTGTNKFFGYVCEGRIFENICELDIKFGLDHKLIEEFKEDKKPKKIKKQKYIDVHSCY